MQNDIYGADLVSVDAKGRMAVPTKARDALSEERSGQLYLTQHAFDKCLVLYTEAEWEAEARFYNSLPGLKKRVRDLRRKVIGQVALVGLDSAGRFLIPQRLRDKLGLEKKVMFVPAGQRCEIWPEAVWNASQEDIDDITPEELMEDSSMPEELFNHRF